MFERRADGAGECYRLQDLVAVADKIGYEPVAVAEKAHARIVWDCSWAADGACFATASRDKTVSCILHVLVSVLKSCLGKDLDTSRICF